MRQSDPTKESGSKSIVEMYRDAEDEIKRLEAERDALQAHLDVAEAYIPSQDYEDYRRDADHLVRH